MKRTPHRTVAESTVRGGGSTSRSFWKGYLKLSLVTCPVTMSPARSESGKIKFHTINRQTGSRVEARYVDEATGEPVADEDQVKAYQTGDDSFVMLEDDELAAVALESARVIDIESFSPKEAIDWIWYDQPHYLAPSDKIGAEAFSVIRAAMKASDVVGLARVVLYRRERAVLIQPLDRGLILWTLRYGDEVRDSKEYWEGVVAEKPDAKLMTMIAELIDKRAKPWAATMASDPVRENLAKIIASKTSKRPPKATAKTSAPAGNVVSIFDALKKSIESEAKGSK